MINVKSLLKITKSKKVKSLKNNELVYLTILLVLLSLTFNLSIKKEFKIVLLIIAVSICFYRPLLLCPFLIIIYIIYTQNKKKSSKKKKNIIEGFRDTKTKFEEFFNNPDKIDSKKKAEFFINLMKNTEELSEYSKNIEFIKELGDCFFFDITKKEHLKKTIELSKKYDTVQELYDVFEFTDITADKGFNTFPERDQQESLISDKYLKLGLFFFKTKIYNLKRYLVNSANQLGFYAIMNNSFEPEDSKNENYNSLMLKYSSLKKKINELIILFYYFNHRVTKDGEDFYDYNKKIDLENNINIFKVVNKNFITNDKFVLGKMIRDRIKFISDYNLIKDKKIFISFDKKPKDLPKKDYTTEKLLDFHIDNLLDNIEEIKLIDLKSYKLTNRKERKETVTGIFHNLFLFHILNDSNINKYLDEINNSNFAKNNNTLYNTFKNIFNKKKKTFELQIKNEKLMDDMYQFTSESDIFYDNIFFYFSKKYNDKSITKSYPEPEDKKEEDDEEDGEEKEDDDEINPFFEQQQKNFELELDDFLTEDQVKERQEEALEKYYKFLDKENIQKLEVLNNLADNKNLSEKHDKLKLDYIIENFGKETYKIIDEIIIKSKSFFKEIKDSDEDMGIFANYQKYIKFLLDILSIMTKEERVLYSGFIFILLGLFIYFLSDDKPRYVQHRGGFNRTNNLLDLLR